MDNNTYSQLADLQTEAQKIYGSACLEPGLKDTADFAKRVIEIVDTILAAPSRPKCRFCGSPRVWESEQKNLFTGDNDPILVCEKCGRVTRIQ